MKVLLTSNALDVIDSFEEANDEVKSSMRFAMFRALTILEAQIKQNIRVNSGLNVRTGTLLNSIQKEMYDRGIEIVGRIGPENVAYAAIHEEGGDLPARFVKPRLKTVLSWKGPGGQLMFSKGHTIPATHIKARPYLRPAVEEHAQRIANTFGLFIQQDFETNFRS